MSLSGREFPEKADPNETRSGEAIRARLARELRDGREEPLHAPAVADHTLLHRIGSGSYGDVWLARSALGTVRAVKIVYRARFKDDRPYEREFQGILKYEPISRTHESLVHVLHVGRNDAIGCFYYVMELADDAGAPTPSTNRTESNWSVSSLRSYRPRTLASDVARAVRLPPAEAARLTLMLTKAVGHLHSRGLVHRDIKPSNVIFVGGQPKLADIGLVTDMGSSRSFVGTEGFIPPEGPGTPQADLYALGKLLYELATGRDRMDFPQLPPRVDQLPDGEALLEVNEVITRACAPLPQERYASATELEADLNSFLAGRSLRRSRSIERYLARLKRAVALACAMLAILATALWFSKREERHALETARVALERAEGEARSREREAELRRRAEAAERQTEQQLYTALLEQSRALVRSGKPGQRFQALDAVRRAAAISNRVELRREALAAIGLPDLRLKHEIPLGPEFTLQCLDPALQRIALCRGRGPVEIRTVPGSELLATLPASTNLVTWGATWSRDGRFLAIKRDYSSSGDRACLEVWEVDKVRRVLLLEDARYDARAFHPNSSELLVSLGNNEVAAFDLETGREIARRNVEAVVENLAYSPDGNFVVASYRMTDGCGISVHRAGDAAMVSSQSFTNWVSTVAWHPDGTRVAVLDHGGQVNLMDAQSGRLSTLGQHKAQAVTAVFTPSGDYLVTGGWERELICWDLRTMQRALTISKGGYHARFSDDGHACGIITESGLQLHEFAAPAHRVLAPDIGPRLFHAAFSPDARWLAASADTRLGVWDLASRAGGTRATARSPAHLYWTPDSRELFGSGHDDNAFRWEVQAAPSELISPTVRPLELRAPRGLISLCLASNLITWTTVAGSRITRLDNSEDDEGGDDWKETPPGISRMSPDGRWLGVYRSYGQILHIYQIPELSLVAKLTNSGSIGGFEFSPAQDEVAVSSRTQVEFWSTKTWQRTRKLDGFIGLPLYGVVFQPDGRSMWIVKNYNSAGLYDSHSFEPILSLPDSMLPLALDNAGRHLAVSVDGQRLQVWDLVTVREQLREIGLAW